MAVDTSDFDQLTIAGRLELREQMIAGQEAVGLAFIEGRATGEMIEGARIRAALVARLDVSLTKCGVEVPPPFWDE